MSLTKIIIFYFSFYSLYNFLLYSSILHYFTSHSPLYFIITTFYIFCAFCLAFCFHNHKFTLIAISSKICSHSKSIWSFISKMLALMILYGCIVSLIFFFQPDWGADEWGDQQIWCGVGCFGRKPWSCSLHNWKSSWYLCKQYDRYTFLDTIIDM